MSDTLTDPRLHRRHEHLLEALDTIVEYWRGAHEPPVREGARTRSKPSSKPPLPVGVLSTLDAAWRDLRSWGQLVMEERDLTLGPRAMTGPDLALFLARHADWLSRHDAADEALTELAHHARKVEDMAKGNVTRRLAIGPCPDMTLVQDVEPPTFRKCEGELTALVHYSEDMLPAVVRCSEDQEHVWTPSQWPALGRKLGRTSHAGAQALVDAIAGRATVRYRAG